MSDFKEQFDDVKAKVSTFVKDKTEKVVEFIEYQRLLYELESAIKKDGETITALFAELGKAYFYENFDDGRSIDKIKNDLVVAIEDEKELKKAREELLEYSKKKQPLKDSNVVYCSNCGEKSTTDKNFCYKCGTKL